MALDATTAGVSLQETEGLGMRLVGPHSRPAPRRAHGEDADVRPDVDDDVAASRDEAGAVVLPVPDLVAQPAVVVWRGRVEARPEQPAGSAAETPRQGG